MLAEILLALTVLAIPLLWAKAFINKSRQRGPHDPAPKNKRDAGLFHREKHVFED